MWISISNGPYILKNTSPHVHKTKNENPSKTQWDHKMRKEIDRDQEQNCK